MSTCIKSSHSLELKAEEEELSSEENDLHEETSNYDLVSTDDILHCYRKPFDVKCLGEIELSRSSLLKDPYYIFGLIEDLNLSDLLYRQGYEKIYDYIGVDRYRDLCKKYQTFNVKKFEHMLLTTEADLSNFGLSNKGARAVFETLGYNEFVEYCNVSCCYFSPFVGKYISSMLSLNKTLKVLILRECRLKSDGIQFLAEGISKNETLTELDVSWNYMGDKAAKVLLKAIKSNKALHVLNLSHNLLTSACGEALGKTLEVNYFIHDLDLSWNNINEMPGTKLLFEGIRENRLGALTTLKMSWNSLVGIPGGGPLGACIKNSKGLKYLDLRFNRLNGKALEFILSGVKESETLQELILANNCYKLDELNLIVETFSSDKKLSLKVLDLSNHHLDKINKPLIEKLSNWKKVIKFAGYLSDFEIIGPDYEMVLLNRCKELAEGGKKKKKGAKQHPFGIFFHEITQSEMSKNNFNELIASLKISKIENDLDLMKEIQKTFSNETGQIRIGDMRDKFLSAYPNTPRPPPKLYDLIPEVENTTEANPPIEQPMEETIPTENVE